MKRTIAIVMMTLVFAINIRAKELEHEKIEINDSTITLTQAWDGVMRWVVTNEDNYGMRIAYENLSTGTMIIKGKFRDDNNILQCVRNDLMRPIASFTIEVNCSNGGVTAEMTEANYEYKVGYGSVYSLRTPYLEICQQEMEEVVRIMRYKGEKVNCYDSWFEETAEEYSAKKKEAEDTEVDETAPKKERKKAKKYLEQNRWRSTPYNCIYGMPILTASELFYGKKGLASYIRKS